MYERTICGEETQGLSDYCMFLEQTTSANPTGQCNLISPILQLTGV